MLRFLFAGESHGKGLTTIIEGLPAGLRLSEDEIAHDLRRRQGGYGRGGRQQIERDRAEILSGVRHGYTLGSPLALWIQNRDWTNWQQRMSAEPVDEPIEAVTRLRPGHADMAGAVKYGHSDVRNILERASARETAARVAVGSVCRRFLAEFGIAVHSHVVAIGSVEAPDLDPRTVDWATVETSPVRCAQPETAEQMVAAIDKARTAGDTLGGIFEVVATGVPIGLGSHVQWDRRLDCRIAGIMLSIPAAKGVEIGHGFAGARLPGSQVHDVFTNREILSEGGVAFRRQTNRAGGVEGGMSNGEPIAIHVAMKPISTLLKPLPSIDLLTGAPVQAHYERSDVCVVPAAGVIGEAMLCIVLAEAFVEKFGGDHVEETRRNYRGYLASMEQRFSGGA
ncbi:MAG: chorismate synthase [Chloroflexi bacterium]|nr:chorismate synthase [Chloroflexota bacterium]